MKEVQLFVPGRLCLFGEHSDWAGRHRNTNSEITEGYAIVTGIEEGIYATAVPSKKFIIHDNVNKDNFEIDMNLKKLQKIANSNSYYSYMCGVAAYIKENYNVDGLEITITKITLPIKKGLSSSAAICVLVARAFNKIYNLQLNTIGEMQAAYFGENKTPSRCGRLDQACAFGVKPVSMMFNGDDLSIKKLKVGTDFYWVFANLMAAKDTKKILSDLNSAYPYAQDEISKGVQKYLGDINKDINERARRYFEEGNLKAMGALMNEAQEMFDKYLMPACDELIAPKLHETLKNPDIQKWIYGGKGVGSQGDGCIQFLAKDADSQKKLVKFLKEKLGMDSYSLTIKKYEEIKKAVVPIAGMGSRMYPITKVIPKDFLPVFDKGMVKPALMVLLEELDSVGIEEIYLVIDRTDLDMCKKLFSSPLSKDLQAKLSREMLDYENKINRIGKKIKYVYQDDKWGLGHAVSLCSKHIKDDPFLLLLGDQIYSSNNGVSCIKQVIDAYQNTGKMTLSVTEVELDRVSSYGILSGNLSKDKTTFEVTSFIEKPTSQYAEQFLGVKDGSKNKYFAIFGIYALHADVLDVLDEMVDNYVKGNGEIQITNAIDKVRQKVGAIAFIPDGRMFDIGTPKNYKDTWDNYK